MAKGTLEDTMGTLRGLRGHWGDTGGLRGHGG